MNCGVKAAGAGRMECRGSCASVWSQLETVSRFPAGPGLRSINYTPESSLQADQSACVFK